MTARGGRRPRKRKPAKRPENESSWSDVVVAVIRDGDKVLVTRRPPGAHLGDHDEFPGGRRAAGEALADACTREVKEEVGLDVTVEKPLHIGWYEGEGRRLALTFFECRVRGSTALDPKVVSERGARWVEVSQLPTLKFPPANAGVVRLLAGGAAPPAHETS